MLAFTLASYVPFFLCLWLLGLVLRRELRSTTTALAGVAAFSLSSLHSETAYWYSASSFTWALAWTLACLLWAGRAARGEGKGGCFLVGAAVAAALAPACSAIGLLAGPLGVLRLGMAADRPWRTRPRVAALAPIVGTALYLTLCSAFRYQDVLTGSFETRADLRSGLPYALCAPTNVLVPGLFGRPPVELQPPFGPNLAVATLALAGVLLWAGRSGCRALVLGGLWLIAGGYAMTYGFRTQRFGLDGLFNVERYHLFPLLGFVVWLALAARPWLSRFDRRPLLGWAAATGLAALLTATHLGAILNHSCFYHFPTQARTLAAVERLGVRCRREGIAREQAVAALDTIRLRWGDPLDLLPPTPGTPAPADRQVRPVLLAGLSPADREALWGGMDVAPYLRRDEGEPASVGRLVKAYRVRSGRAGRYLAAGWPSYLEFTLPEGTGRAQTLSVPGGGGGAPGGPGPLMEVWWAADEYGWSEARSVRWEPDPAHPAQGWAVPLDRLPHWDDKARLIRFMFRTGGVVSLGEPRLLR